MANIFCDLLDALHVPHTDSYSTHRFETMPFHTLFGMVHLLKDYGVAAMGLDMSSTRDDIGKLPVPFLATLVGGSAVVVTEVGDTHVHYISDGVAEDANISTFISGWTGNALIVKADSASREPNYPHHRLIADMNTLSNVGLVALILTMTVYMFCYNRLWTHVADLVVIGLDITGLVLSCLLLQKQSGHKSRLADRVCSTIQAHGCDHVMASGGTFLGIFHWSEVGFAYFSVSVATLLFFPVMIPWLAILNLCCLPYTVWSILYQKFKAHAWCTLCLGVQLTLWLLAAAYLAGKWWLRLPTTFPPVLPHLLLLLCAYGIVMLGTNRLLSIITKNPEINDNAEN